TQVIGSAMDVGIILTERAHHGVEHQFRLLGRRGTVEVDQRLTVDFARQDREVGADLLDVVRQLRCGCGLVHARTFLSHALMAPPNRSRTVSSLISVTTSARKPSTSSMRAVSGSIPRASR